MLKILIIEHMAVVRAGIREWLSDVRDFTLIGEAASAEEGVSMVHAAQPDIVLLDIAMPRKNGYEALNALKAVRKDLPVLIISSRPEKFYALELMHDGADGYFIKQDSAEELVRTIRAICNGKPGKEEENPAANCAPPCCLHERLNAREYEVFHSMCRGERPSETARKLSLSLTTVNKYRKRVFAKMGVDGMPGLIRYAVEHKIDVFQN